MAAIAALLMMAATSSPLALAAPSDSFNHFAQDANFNRGTYRALEDSWAKDVRAGKHVSVDIVAHYPGASLRPDRLITKWSVGGETQRRSFANEPKGN